MNSRLKKYTLSTLDRILSLLKIHPMSIRSYLWGSLFKIKNDTVCFVIFLGEPFLRLSFFIYR